MQLTMRQPEHYLEQPHGCSNTSYNTHTHTHITTHTLQDTITFIHPPSRQQTHVEVLIV